MIGKRRFWLEWLGAFALCAAIAAVMQSATPYLPETDGYFHIKFALELRRYGFFRDGFPWAAFGLWKDGFSDTAPLFHVFLIPFTYGNLVFGLKLAAVLLSAFAVSSFFAILTLNKVRHRYYWFAVMLLGGWGFWWRVLVPRPQLLSIALLLWSLHFLVNGRRRAFAAVSFLYPYAYSAGFLPQIFAFLRAAYLRVFAKKKDGGLLLAGVTAFAAGMFLHPYFPKNLRMFWVQNFMTLYYAVTHRPNMGTAGELTPLLAPDYFATHIAAFAHLAVLAFLLAHKPKALSERTRVLMPITTALLALTAVSRRFMEYSVPAATLLAAFAWDDVSEFPLSDNVLTGWLVALAAAAGLQFGGTWRAFRDTKPPQFEALSRAAAAAAPQGETIFTCDWDETPPLFFYDDDHRYMVLMDPTFLNAGDPEVLRVWSDATNLRMSADEVHRAFTDVFHARVGVCGSKFDGFKALLKTDERYRILSEGPEGFAFEVR